MNNQMMMQQGYGMPGQMGMPPGGGGMVMVRNQTGQLIPVPISQVCSVV